MFGEIFYWVLNMSIAGTLVGCILLCLRKVKKIPRRVIFFLWLLPIIRLWIPIGIGSRFSLMNLLDGIAIKSVVVWEEAPVEMLYSNYIGGAQSYSPFIYKTNLLGSLFFIASVVWIVFMAIAVFTTIILYRSAKKELKPLKCFKDKKHIKNVIYIENEICLTDKLFLCENVTSPIVFGIRNPKILIPSFLTESKDLEYILAHENVHIRRRDNLWRMLAVLTCCFHWFNPFVWLFLKCFLEDMELSCDECVLKEYGEDKRKAYATALLNVEMEKSLFASAFGGVKTRVRIEKILSYKRVTVFSAICFAVLIGVMTIVLLTNAAI